MKRVFIAIKASPELQHRAVQWQRMFAHIPDARLIQEDDLHVTLVPPWNVAEEALRSVAERLAKALSLFAPFTLRFTAIASAPGAAPTRLIWAEAETSDTLRKLKASVTEPFGVHEDFLFHPHMTLVRFRNGAGEYESMAPVFVDVRESVSAVTLFESPQGEGAGYRVLATIPL